MASYSILSTFRRFVLLISAPFIVSSSEAAGCHVLYDFPWFTCGSSSLFFLLQSLSYSTAQELALISRSPSPANPSPISIDPSQYWYTSSLPLAEEMYLASC